MNNPLLSVLNRKFLKSTLVILLFLVLFLVRGGYFYGLYIQTDEKLIERFSKVSPHVSIERYVHQGVTIRYLEMGNKQKPPVMLIHGSPASITMWSYLIKHTNIAQDYHLFVVDRPGYGQSDPGNPYVSIKEEAQLLNPLLDRIGKPTTLIGNSYGGPVSTMMSYLHPEKVRQNILVSSVSDPETEPVFFITHIIKHWPISLLIPPPLMVANHEKLAHKEQLRMIEPMRYQIEVPTVIVHGSKDRIAPPANIEYMASKIDEQYLSISVYQDQSHFFPVQKPEAIVKEIK